MSEVMRVKSTTKVAHLAQAIASALREEDTVKLSAVGVGANHVAMRAIGAANSLGIHPWAHVNLVQVQFDDTEREGCEYTIARTSDAAKEYESTL